MVCHKNICVIIIHYKWPNRDWFRNIESCGVVYIDILSCWTCIYTYITWTIIIILVSLDFSPLHYYYRHHRFCFCLNLRYQNPQRFIFPGIVRWWRDLSLLSVAAALENLCLLLYCRLRLRNLGYNYYYYHHFIPYLLLLMLIHIL